jgi:hypothetical protein
VQGGLLQQLLKVDFSRNITPRWNAGFNYLRPPRPCSLPTKTGRRTGPSTATRSYSSPATSRPTAPTTCWPTCRTSTTPRTTWAGCSPSRMRWIRSA